MHAAERDLAHGLGAVLVEHPDLQVHQRLQGDRDVHRLLTVDQRTRGGALRAGLGVHCHQRERPGERPGERELTRVARGRLPRRVEHARHLQSDRRPRHRGGAVAVDDDPLDEPEVLLLQEDVHDLLVAGQLGAGLCVAAGHGVVAGDGVAAEGDAGDLELACVVGRGEADPPDGDLGERDRCLAVRLDKRARDPAPGAERDDDEGLAVDGQGAGRRAAELRLLDGVTGGDAVVALDEVEVLVRAGRVGHARRLGGVLVAVFLVGVGALHDPDAGALDGLPGCVEDQDVELG